MFSRFLIAVAAAVVVLGGSVCANAAEVLNFGIISTESSQNLKKQLWDPFLADDMEKATGFKVKAFFASDYAEIIEGMRFKKVDLCWIGNKGAIQMVDRSDGSVFARPRRRTGTDGYYSLLVVNKESPLKSVDDVLKERGWASFQQRRSISSTSGFLVPGYVFAKNNADPKIFRTWLPPTHKIPTCARRRPGRWTWRPATTKPSAASKSPILKRPRQIREIWRSPLIERSAGVAQQPSKAKKKIADFIFRVRREG